MTQTSKPQTPSAETLAWIEQFRADAEARAAATTPEVRAARIASVRQPEPIVVDRDAVIREMARIPVIPANEDSFFDHGPVIAVHRENDPAGTSARQGWLAGTVFFESIEELDELVASGRKVYSVNVSSGPIGKPKGGRFA